MVPHEFTRWVTTMSVWRSSILIAAIMTVLAPAQVVGAPAACTIVEGSGIGGIQIGMGVKAALAISGPAASQQASGSTVVYALRAPWAYLIASRGFVEQVGTRSSECRTARGVGPGSALPQVREAYAASPVSTLTPTKDGDVLSYPFNGIAFLLRQERVAAVEVFRAEGIGQARQAPPASPAASPVVPGAPASPAPSPAPATAPGAWGIRSLSARVDQTSLVVTGTIENRSRTQSVYADVRAFNPTGRQIGQSDAPVFPNPVPSGGTATFEVRVTVDDVVRRYSVTIRPVGFVTGSLVTRSGEITQDRQQFASLVAKQLDVVVQTTINPPNRDTFVIQVTNRSALVVASVTVGADITVTCQLPITSPLGPRSVQEVRSGTTVVQQLRPGATARVALPISAGVCTEFGTWSVQTRVGEVRIAEGD